MRIGRGVMLTAVLMTSASVYAAPAADGGLSLLTIERGKALAPAVENGKLTVEGEDRPVARLTGSPGKPTTITLAPSAGVWDLSTRAAITLRLRNPNDAALTVRARAEMPEAGALMDGSQNGVELLPGETRDFAVRLTRRPEDPTYQVFEPFYMYFKGMNVRDNTLDPARVARLVLSVAFNKEGQSLDVESIVATGEGTPAPVPFFPFIDGYGQYVHGDWQGKIYRDDDFAERVKEEERERADQPGAPDRNEYGGWASGPTLKATGFFHATKHEGKWWLVDPAGKLYWSYGPTGVGYGGDLTPITDRKHWFASLPEEGGPLGQFYKNGRGATYRYYSDREWRGLDIQRVNLFRKYGPDYAAKVAEVSHARLRSWGFNTIGNWSAPEIFRMRRTPYTVAINSPGVSVMKWTDGHSFQDVYDERWEPGLYAEMEKHRGTTAGDPWNIGYFVDNERCVGWRPRAAALGELALKAPPTQPAKAKFVAQLKAKYPAVEALNESWKATYASWEALLDSREPPALKDNEALLRDCGDFGMAFCERYFSVSRAAVKRVAPDNMFLGSRFYGHTDPELVRLAGKYWDVISYNIYDNPPTARANQYRALDLPILSTEWGVESDVLQTPFRDAKLTATPPAERAAKITRYVEAALAHPLMVGAHFFQFRDQPLSGRPDGEATLRGFVNVADTPNFELVQANRKLGYAMYRTRADAR